MSVIITHGNGQSSLAVVRSLGRKEIDNTVVASKKHAIAFYSKYCNHRLISDYDIDFFLSLSEKDIVMPIDEDVMLNLAKNRTKLKCKLPFPDYSTLEKVINKSSMIKHAIENNIPCPKTWFVNCSDDIDKIEKELDFPVVIKPDRGTGGKGITFVETPNKLRNLYRYISNNHGHSFIQEKIPYIDKYKVEVLLNNDFKVRATSVLKVIRQYPFETGPSCFVETVNRPDLLKWSLEFLKPLNYYGVADFDFVIDKRDGKPKFMEINPRFWGSLQAAITAGVDFPYLLYKMVEEGDVNISYNYKTGVKCRNIIFNDMRHAFEVLKGKYTIGNKLSALAEFVKFHKDDSYYIFAYDDVKPFIAYIYNKFHI